MNQIVVVLAVFKPNLGFLDAQIKSLAAQKPQVPDVVFVNADTTAGADIRRLAARHGLQFHIVGDAAPLSPVRAFEFGLTQALRLYPDAQLFALCDQDDIWKPNRIHASAQALRKKSVDLVHSDTAVMDATGLLQHPSLFALERRQRRARPRDLLYRNSITGMTTVMTRDVVERALPFPPQDGMHYFHDLWLGLAAATGRGVAFLPAPLVQYRQHGGNAVGAITARKRAQINTRNRLRMWAGNYALARYLAECAWARGWTHRDLECFQNSASRGTRFFKDALAFALRGHGALAKIAVQFGCIAVGRRVWAIWHALHHGRRAALQGFDQRLFQLAPGCAPPVPAPVAEKPPAKPWWAVFDGRMQANWTRVMDAPHPRVQILLPTVNPAECFAGIKTALDFGTALAQRGHPVRFVATDLPILSMANTRQFIAGNMAPPNACDIACGVNANALSFHPGDTFVATAWWTAHMAQSQLASGDFTAQNFAYLIQDFEPGFYPWGTEYATAAATYDFDFTPIFNTTYLRQYFATHVSPRFDGALVFRPSINQSLYGGLRRKPNVNPGAKRTIALYGRPGVARNLFEMSVEVLGNWIQTTGLTPDQVHIVSVGMQHADIELPNGLVLHSLGKIAWNDYPRFVASVDLALSLMLSPHPSHPPLELAMAAQQSSAAPPPPVV